MIPTEPGVVEITTDEDWREDFEFFLESEAQPNDLSDAEVVGAMSLKRRGEAEQRLELTGDRIVVDGNKVTIVVDRLDLKAMPEGIYDFALRSKRAGDVDDGLIRGRRQLTHGPT